MAPETHGLQDQPDPPALAARRCDGYEWRGDVPWKCQLPLGHKGSCKGSTATVWIVRWDYYDDWGIEGVFTTEESAQRHADALNADPHKRLGSASVEDYEVQP